MGFAKPVGVTPDIALRDEIKQRALHLQRRVVRLLLRSGGERLDQFVGSDDEAAAHLGEHAALERAEIDRSFGACAPGKDRFMRARFVQVEVTVVFDQPARVLARPPDQLRERVRAPWLARERKVGRATDGELRRRQGGGAPCHARKRDDLHTAAHEPHAIGDGFAQPRVAGPVMRQHVLGQQVLRMARGEAAPCLAREEVDGATTPTPTFAAATSSPPR